MDIICEPAEEMERGAKLWVYSRISGILEAKGWQVDGVDTMKFDAAGQVSYTKDVQRTVADTTATSEMKTAWGTGYVSDVQKICNWCADPLERNRTTQRVLWTAMRGWDDLVGKGLVFVRALYNFHRIFYVVLRYSSCSIVIQATFSIGGPGGVLHQHQVLII